MKQSASTLNQQAIHAVANNARRKINMCECLALRFALNAFEFPFMCGVYSARMPLCASVLRALFISRNRN